MTEVIMPKMGDGMEEGTLLEWLKQEGDAVKSGDVIGTIQTDKATLELEAPGSGTLAGLLIQAGETVPVGKPIAALLRKGEELPASWGSGAPTEPTPVAPEEVLVANAPIATSLPDVAQDRIKASPLARRIARESGINLALVVGTGPRGRITESDVRKAAEKGVSPAFTAPVVEAIAAPAVAATPGDTEIPLNRLRQIIAQRTQQSKQLAPHFYVTVEVDIERIMELRAMFEADGSGKVSINDFVVKASAVALREMPEVNASFQDTKLIQYGAVNIGVAAAVEDGLLVPVIKNADQLSLRQISSRSRELVAKARDGKLLPDEMTGSTFSISNMGMLDVDDFGAIINLPNAAIIAVSSARKKVVVGENDELEIRTRMNITGSFDHRVLDGAVGAKFMNVIKRALESPTRLLG